MEKIEITNSIGILCLVGWISFILWLYFGKSLVEDNKISNFKKAGIDVLGIYMVSVASLIYITSHIELRFQIVAYLNLSVSLQFISYTDPNQMIIDLMTTFFSYFDYLFQAQSYTSNLYFITGFGLVGVISVISIIHLENAREKDREFKIKSKASGKKK